MSRYYDDDDDNYRKRRSSSRRRDHSRGRSPSPTQEGYYEDPARLSPPYMSSAQGRLTYDTQIPVYPPPPSASNPDFSQGDTLQVPSHRHHRPRSQPPASSGRYDDSRRGDSRSPSPDRARSGSRSPLGKAKHAVENTFSTSTSGIGVGVLGAIVGGLAAREASEAAQRARDKKGHGQGHGHHSSQDHSRATLISTIVGAAVGGLGANAIEKRVESRRHDRDQDRYDDGGRDYKSRELEYHSNSRGISARERSRSRGRERNLVISRSPSVSRSRSNSNSRFERPQHGGAADDYYNSASRRDNDYR